MTNPNDDETVQVEKYLKTFHPRAVSALDLQPQRNRLGIALTLGLAAALVAVFVVLGVRRRQSPPVVVNVHTHTDANPAVTVMQLNAAVRRDDSADDVIYRAARSTLPRTTTPNTALNALSKE